MKLDIPVYGGTIHFFTDFKKFNSQHKKATKEEVEHALGWTATYTENGKQQIMVGIFDNDPQTLVHECVHASLLVLERCQIDPTAESGEPMAYFTDCLYGMLVKHLKEN